MAIDYTKAPYYDDYKEDQKFLKILFRPGRAVQARELTQLQTILQKQVARGSSFIFKNGSVVYGGSQKFEKTTIRYLALQDRAKDNTLVDIKNFENKHIRNTSGSIKARIHAVERRTQTEGHGTGDPDTLFIEYDVSSSGEFPPLREIVTYNPDDATEAVYSANAYPMGEKNMVHFTGRTLLYSGEHLHTGNCSVYTVEPGIFYWEGMFLSTDKQTVVLEKYDNKTTWSVGFRVNEETVTSDTDESLYDPASGFSNFTAPGADRKRMSITLTKVGDGATLPTSLEDNYFEIARILEGNLDWYIRDPQYGIIEDTWAQRTYEESGNYTVIPYLAVKHEGYYGKEDNDFSIELKGGKAYVKGFRQEQIKRRFKSLKKARIAITKEVRTGPFEPRNFVRLYDHANTINSADHQNANSLPEISKNQLVYLHSLNKTKVSDHSLATANAWNSTLAATARIQSFAYDEVATRITNTRDDRTGKVYKLWIYDVKPNKISGKVGSPNKLKITAVNMAGAPDYTTFLFEEADSGRHAYHVNDRYWHGFANSTPDPGGTLITSNSKLPHDNSSTGDTISIRGTGPGAGGFIVRNIPVRQSDCDAILVEGDWSKGETFDADTYDLYIHRNTHGYSSRRTLMLDANTAAQWNDAYVGASIKITAGPSLGEVRTITGYCGNNAAAGLYQIDNGGSDSNTHLVEGLTGRPRLLVVDREFSEASNTSTEYEISLGIHQARSALGQVTYTDGTAATLVTSPAVPELQWNIDTITGIAGNEKISEVDPIGIRESGKTIFSSTTVPSLIPLGRYGIRSAQTFQTSTQAGLGNTTFTTHRFYDVTVTNSKINNGDFDTDDGDYGSPKYWNSSDESFLSGGGGSIDLEEKTAYWTIVDKNTGRTVPPENFTITPVGNSPRKYDIDLSVHLGDSTTTGHLFRIITPVMVKNARPKLKSLVTGNTSHWNGTHKGDTGQTQIEIRQSSDGPDSEGDNTVDGTSLLGIVAGGEINLGIADAHNVAVYSSFDDSTELTNEQMGNPDYEITEYFDFDNGQRDHLYDHAKLTLKSDAPVGTPNGHCVAVVDYWSSDQVNRGFFAVDSYKHVTDVFHGTTESTDYSTIRFNDNIRVISANTKVAGWVYDQQLDNSSGDSTLRITGMHGRGANTWFEPGELIRAEDVAESAAWIKVGAAVATNADISYSEIPKYRSEYGHIFPLSTVFDFRPVKKREDFSANSELQIPLVLTPYDSTWARIHDPVTGDNETKKGAFFVNTAVSYYQARVDTISLNSAGLIVVNEGVPSDHPKPPAPNNSDPGSELPLYHVTIPAWTNKVEAVSCRRINSQRYTMKDIGRLDKRLQNVEYYVALSALEKATKDMTILGADGLERFKNGILIDNFEGWSVVDVNNLDTRGKFAIDHNRQMLHPYLKNQDNKNFKIDLGSSYGVKGHIQNTVVTLEYSNTPFITQPIATVDTVSVNPMTMTSFNGTIKLTPDFDRWIDYTVNPDVLDIDLRPDLEGLPTPGVDTVLGEWKGGIENYGVFAITVDYDVATGEKFFRIDTASKGDRHEIYQTLGDADEAASYTLDFGQIDSFYDNQLSLSAIDTTAYIEGIQTSMSILPYMRKRTIIVDAKGLKPYSPVNAFFGDLPVNRYVSRCNEVYVDPETKTGLFSVERGWQENTPTEYETIKLLSSPSTIEGYATLIAIRKNEFGTVLHIAPTTNSISGVMDDNGLSEGFYTSASPGKRFSATGSATIEGMTSGATYTLGNDDAYIGGTATDFKKNGHFFGQVSHGNTMTHSEHTCMAGQGGWIGFAPDAHAYVANNFGYEPEFANDTISFTGVVNIVSGDASGRQFRIDEYDPSIGNGQAFASECESFEVPSVGDWYHIVNTPSKKLKDDTENGSGTDHYGLPVPCGVAPLTNRHGEFFGVFHLPASERTRFSYGKAQFVISDRSDNLPMFTTSFAYAEYFACGEEQTTTDALISTRAFIPKLERAMNFELSNNPLETGSLNSADPENAGGSGIFAIVTDVEVIKGGKKWDPQGEGAFGTGKDFGNMVFGSQMNGQDKSAYEAQGIGFHNWSGGGTTGGTIHSPNFPGIFFTGGDIDGVQGYCEVTAGSISAAKISSFGGGWVAAGQDIRPPTASVFSSVYRGKKGGHTITHGKNEFVVNISTNADVISEKLGFMGAGDDLTTAQIEAMAEFTATEYSDPVAQSFAILKDPSAKTDNGVFITGIDIFLSRKPTILSDDLNSDADLPITLDLREMVNGQPGRNRLATGGGSIASVTLNADQCNVADSDPDGTNIVPNVEWANTATPFVFDAPVYLMPGKQYAFVVSSNSDKYYIWRATTSEFVVGTGIADGDRVPLGGAAGNPILATTSKATGGAMFSADQVGAPVSPWKLESDSDLMFVIRRAVFTPTTTATVMLAAGETSPTDVPIHDFKVNVVDARPRKTGISYSYSAPDSSGLAGGFVSLQENAPYENLETGLQFSNGTDGGDSDPNKDYGSFQVKARLSTTSSFVSPVIDSTQYNIDYASYKINNGELNIEGIKIKNKGENYKVGDTFITTGAGGGSGAVVTVTSNTHPGGVLKDSGLALTSPGSGYHSTPTFVDGTIATTIGERAEIVYGGENEKSGGNADVRYITRRINLREDFDARDLKAYLTAHKPEGTEIHVYYKVHAVEDSEKFEDKKWTRMVCKNADHFNMRYPEARDENQPVTEYEFDTQGESDQITYDSNDGTASFDTFESFAIKIVMFSDAAHKHPMVRDMRAIALT